MAKILIVEDNKDLADIYKNELVYNAYEVSWVANAVEVFHTMDDFNPDLVLLDIMLPDGDGLEILKKMKANPKYANIKVIIMSNIDAPAVINNAYSLGADGYIIKATILPSQLTDEVKTFIK